jgi:hypothetical protein
MTWQSSGTDLAKARSYLASPPNMWASQDNFLCNSWRLGDSVAFLNFLAPLWNRRAMGIHCPFLLASAIVAMLKKPDFSLSLCSFSFSGKNSTTIASERYTIFPSLC